MRAVIPLAAFALAACGGPADTPKQPAEAVTQIGTEPNETQSVPAPAAEPLSPPATAETAAEPDADSAEAAAAVVRDYYARIARADYRGAWALWEDADMSAEAFADSFGKYASYRATVGAPGRVDAGAGQRYVTIPVEIAGALRDGGRPFAMAGDLILHKTADIPGATAEQRSWRIRESAIRPRP